MMPNPYFSFKQFTVRHDRCAMKVGTDGVLLGAWSPVDGVRTALDIGTGTGLVALMLAQRSEAQIVAVELDEAAAGQARENVAESPWPDRIQVEQADICTFRTESRFDLIVSNPPYFVDSLKCPSGQRTMARHAEGLDFGQLMQAVGRLLQPDGMACLVLPSDGREALVQAAREAGLVPVRQTWVHTKPDADPKRVLLAFRFAAAVHDRAGEMDREKDMNIETDHLTIELARHVYSEAYIALTKDFYLKM